MMHRWFCGFSSEVNYYQTNLPEPQAGKMLWDDVNNPLWICGNWAKQQVITLFDKSIRLAIVGTCLEPDKSLVQLFRNAVESRNYSRLMRLPGSYNLIIQDGFDTYIFVDAAGLKAVFYSEYESGIIYSSLGLALKELLKLPVDPSWFATSLMGLELPDIWQGRSPFCQVKTVPPGHYLHISSGKALCKQYWHAPQEYINFSEATEKLREQLLKAVEGRVCLYENVTSDLSGGFDSTSLALIAAKSLAKHNRKLHTITMKAFAETEDVKWAQHAASLYPNIVPEIIDSYKLSTKFNIWESIPLTDIPSASILPTDMTDCWMKTIKSKNSQIHLSGEGGDEVLTASYAYLADLLRRAQIGKFLQHAYGWSRITYRSPLSLMIRAAKLSLTSYTQGLLKTVEKIKDGQSKLEVFTNQIFMQNVHNQVIAWDSPPELANWYTKESVDFVIAELQQWAKVTPCFADVPGQHESITSIYCSAFTARIEQQAAESYGVNLELPYFDSLVVDTCLRAKPEERTSPFLYKPLIAQALNQYLPKSIFARTNKSDFSADEYNFVEKNMSGLHDIFKTSILADMGLIDINKFRLFIDRLNMGINVISSSFTQTLAFELWLRAIKDSSNIFWKSRN